MRIDFVTLFPDMFPSVMDASIVGRAGKAGLLSCGCVNPRDIRRYDRTVGLSLRWRM